MKKDFTHFWFDMVGRVWLDQGGVYSLLILSDANPAVPGGSQKSTKKGFK